MKCNLLMATLAGMGLLTGSLNAAVITYLTPGGSTASGGAVDSSATFTTSAGQLQITLQDLETNPKDVAQLISDLTFSLSSGQTSGTLASSSGQEISIDKNGNATIGSSVNTGWELISGSTFVLSVLGTPTGPSHLIIGPGPYSNANGSIAGNMPHNAFLNGTATFTIDISGLTANDTVNSATFSYGTTAGIDVTATPNTAVPDGGTTVLLLGAALSGLGLIRRILT